MTLAGRIQCKDAGDENIYFLPSRLGPGDVFGDSSMPPSKSFGFATMATRLAFQLRANVLTTLHPAR